LSVCSFPSINIMYFIAELLVVRSPVLRETTASKRPATGYVASRHAQMASAVLFPGATGARLAPSSVRHSRLLEDAMIDLHNAPRDIQKLAEPLRTIAVEQANRLLADGMDFSAAVRQAVAQAKEEGAERMKTTDAVPGGRARRTDG
jgi:hypothetical protein